MFIAVSDDPHFVCLFVAAPMLSFRVVGDVEQAMAKKVRGHVADLQFSHGLNQHWSCTECHLPSLGFKASHAWPLDVRVPSYILHKV